MPAAPTSLLDNMDPAMPRGRAGRRTAGHRSIRRITLDTVAAVAESGVDYASSGSITHSSPNLDIKMMVAIR